MQELAKHKPKDTKPGNFGVSAKGVKVVVKAKRKAVEGPLGGANGSTTSLAGAKKPKGDGGAEGSDPPAGGAAGSSSPAGGGALLGLGDYGSSSSSGGD